MHTLCTAPLHLPVSEVADKLEAMAASAAFQATLVVFGLLPSLSVRFLGMLFFGNFLSLSGSNMPVWFAI